MNEEKMRYTTEEADDPTPEPYSVRGDLRQLWNAIELLRKTDADQEARIDDLMARMAHLERLVGE